MLYQKILLAAASSVALVASGQAVAQEAQPQAANSSGQAAESSGLDDIIVTAQKREQSLQDVPISITAFNAEAIASLGAQTIGDLDTFTPGLSINDSSVTQPSFTIRGVSTDDFGIGTDPAVGIFIDGVYSARSGAALIFFNDIERVEVLKGPQGTLFGRNTSAGAISIITKKPVDKLEAAATVRIGNYGKHRIDAMVNVPITDTLFLRVNGVYNKRRGYLTDAVTGAHYERENNWSGRAALRFEPSSDTDITLSYDHDDTDKDGPAAIGIGPFALSQDPDGPFTNDVIQSREARILNAVTLTANHDFGPVTLTSISAYKKFTTSNREDEDGTNLISHYLDTENIEKNSSFYQEFRLAHSGDRLNLVVGASYFQERGRQTSRVTAFTDSIDTTLGAVVGFPVFSLLDSFGLPVFGLPWREDMNNYTRNKSYAAFGDATLAVTPKLNLTVGLRYTRDEKNFSWLNGPRFSPGLSAVTAPGALFNAIILAVNPQAEPPFPDAAMIDVNTFLDAAIGGDIIFNAGPLEGIRFTSKRKFSDVSPRFVIDYKATDDVLLFASATRGYKAGGFNSVEINSFFAPESVWSYEAGAKTELFDRRLRFNVSGYYFKYANRQSIILDNVAGSGVPQYVTQSGDSEAYGIDLETQFVVSKSLKLSGVASYIDSTWSKRIERDVDISGQPTGEPSLRFVVGAHYDHRIGGGSSIFADASYSYTSHVRVNDAVRASDQKLENDPVYGDLIDFSKLTKLRSSREIVNARLGWRSPDDRFSVALFADNLFDVRTPRTLNLITAETLGTPYVRMDRPRFWGVELGARF
ncbi:TonB-dependent receptor [Sphingomonas sp. So64.6b]|uniref:TonB-dependent receptor n=1 Tax=Sphingomonas sp. So64.6b TaxID=2997354 RepID=UPI0016038B4C|nr:TonB-dependent receptor [Sphingomonas sp. So64.6b]QNA84365.1 TonB-dependent receptor [Sphingomonas sp. So64.6b]